MSTTEQALAEVKNWLRIGQTQKAAAQCDALLLLHPNNTHLLYTRALIWVSQNNLVKAAPLLRQANQNPDAFFDSIVLLGKIRTQLGRVQGAARCFWRATKMNPESPEGFHGLGVLYQRMGNLSKAIKFYEKAGRLAPSELVYANIAHAYKGLGEFENAIQAFHQALILNAHFTQAYQGLASLKTYRFSPTEVTTMQTLLAETLLTLDDKNALHFALGKNFHDQQDFTAAFSYYKKANEGTRKQISYSANNTTQITNAFIETFNSTFFNERQAFGCQDKTPIFIVSMPRSGSTLVEQILASHSHIFGGNELPDLRQISTEIGMKLPKSKDFFTDIKVVDVNYCKELGEKYIDRIRKLHKTDKPFITDKMPFNFQLIGFIALIFPNAKIIHVKRNPIDTCLGCYRLPFNENHEFTYDLMELGQYYLDYHRLMQHWHQVLPGKILDVEYEALVADQHTQTQRLLDFCNLPWEDNCLAFYKTQRKVITESAAQVRQPIYKTAINAWKHYEPFIEPLLNTLKPII